jgi:hypothetical protein
MPISITIHPLGQSKIIDTDITELTANRNTFFADYSQEVSLQK